MSSCQLERQPDAVCLRRWTAVSTSADHWLQSNIVTECQHYCLSPWWSFMWEHLAYMPLSIPSSFSIHQKPSLSSDIQNTFPLFQFYMSPSATWWLWLLHCEGHWDGSRPLNSKAPTENWNQTSKISQPSFNIRTNKQRRGTCTSSPSAVSCSTENSETWSHKFKTLKDREREGGKKKKVLQFLYLVCISKTEKQDKSTMQLGSFPFITTGRITIQEPGSSSWLILGAVTLVWGASSSCAVGLPAEEQLSRERSWSQPPAGEGSFCG